MKDIPNIGQAKAVQFNNEGYILTKLSDTDLSPIYKEIDEIQSDFSSATPHNKSLAGNLQREFLLSNEMHAYIGALVAPYVKAYDDKFDYLRHINVLDRNYPIKLDTVWVNYQQKYEFNPLHIHTGVMSFVLWLRVPYKIEDELANPASVYAKMKCPAHFSFVHGSALGEIVQELIPVDAAYEGVLCVFPARMYHQVYPFYTSDGYRVSVSGNFCIDTKG
jgi:hypothetical protein